MTTDPHLWPPEAAEAIRAELVRVTLTGDDRPELAQPSTLFGIPVVVDPSLPPRTAWVGCCKVGAVVHPARCPYHGTRGASFTVTDG